MRLLLDTHVLIWAVNDPRQLTRSAANAITAPSNETFVSAASVWEIAIKAKTGRLKLAASPRDFVTQAQAQLSAALLPVLADHALATYALPAVHRDPFDRLLVAQALQENLVLVTHDAHMSKYPATVLW